jgi:hypothetical protein
LTGHPRQRTEDPAKIESIFKNIFLKKELDFAVRSGLTKNNSRKQSRNKLIFVKPAKQGG